MYKIVGALTVAVGAIVVGAILMAIPVWLLWNGLMPEIFGLPTITLWQALGIAVLSGCLFKGSSSTSSSE